MADVGTTLQQAAANRFAGLGGFKLGPDFTMATQNSGAPAVLPTFNQVGLGSMTNYAPPGGKGPMVPTRGGGLVPANATLGGTPLSHIMSQRAPQPTQTPYYLNDSFLSNGAPRYTGPLPGMMPGLGSLSAANQIYGNAVPTYAPPPPPAKVTWADMHPEENKTREPAQVAQQYGAGGSVPTPSTPGWVLTRGIDSTQLNTLYNPETGLRYDMKEGKYI